MNRGGFLLLAVLLLFQTGFSLNERDLPQGSETESETPAPSETIEPSPIDLPTPTPSPTDASTPTSEPAASATSEASPTQPAFTPTFSPTNTQTPQELPWILISEIAWTGAAASSSDEWIELWNPGSETVDLGGWLLTDGGDIRVPLAGAIAPGSFFLLERTDDTTIRDIPADQIYSGALSNAGESLSLYDISGRLVDSANGDGGPWPAGNTATFGSMERMGTGSSLDSSWCTNDGVHRSGLDAAGNPVNGSPHAAFSGFCAGASPTQTGTGGATPSQPASTSSPTGTSTPTNTPAGFPPRAVIISEIAWAGTVASSADEWIELLNPGTAPVDLSGWVLTDGGDIGITLRGILGPGAFFLLERTDDDTVRDIPADWIYAGSLSNAGETLLLLDPAGNIVDAANRDGGAWPAGSSAPAPASMERAALDEDSDLAWCTNDGIHRNGLDAAGNPINGSPRAAFSGFCAASTPTVTPSPTPTPTLLRTPYPAMSVVVNEVAWAGTAADSSDEWMELYNPGSEPILLDGWVLTDGGDIYVALAGWIPGGGFFLLERGDDQTLSDIPADQIYTGILSNAGETLLLIDPSGNVVDRIEESGWPAGSAAPNYASMERVNLEPPRWASNTGWVICGHDSAGDPVRGTPGGANSAMFPTPTPTKFPQGVLINEFLPKPGSDWNGDGRVDIGDEFIELLNTGSTAVDLGGWILDDIRTGGSRPFVIPQGVMVGPKEMLVFFHSRTRISLNDSHDEVWLYAPDGTRVDGIVYSRTRWPDSAWNRFPDGEGVLRLGFPPTPGESNELPPGLLNPKRKPLPVLEGWREVDCAPKDAPLLVGDGFLTTHDTEANRMAESYGWFFSEGNECFAWAEPRYHGGGVIRNLSPDASHIQTGFGWWWEAWFIW